MAIDVDKSKKELWRKYSSIRGIISGFYDALTRHFTQAHDKNLEAICKYIMQIDNKILGKFANFDKISGSNLGKINTYKSKLVSLVDLCNAIIYYAKYCKAQPKLPKNYPLDQVSKFSLDLSINLGKEISILQSSTDKSQTNQQASPKPATPKPGTPKPNAGQTNTNQPPVSKKASKIIDRINIVDQFDR